MSISEETSTSPKELELIVCSIPKITDDNYFKDVAFEISEQDRAKAGYKIPKATIRPEEFLRRNKMVSSETIADGEKLIMGPPKQMSAKILAGDLTNQPVHLPMNYFDQPTLFPSNQSSTKSQLSDLKPGTLTQLNIGGDQILVAKGPNNDQVCEGFSVGIFNAGKFGSFPNQSITYDPHNALVEDPIKKAKLDQVKSEDLNMNANILNSDYSSKNLPDISLTGQTLAEALIEVTETTIKEPIQEISPVTEITSSTNECKQEDQITQLKLKIEEQDQTIHDLVSTVQSLSQSLRELTLQVTRLTGVVEDKKEEGVLWTLYNKVAWWRN